MAGSEKPACKADSELLLLVEGINDCHAILHLTWLTFKTEPVFGFYECGSDDKVLDKLAATLVRSNAKQKVLGLVLDADIFGASSDQVIQSRLSQLVSRAGSYYSFPAVFPPEGLILDPLPMRPDADRLPKLGVWLMPNNQSFGMLEDLLMSSLASHTAEYTRGVVKQAKSDGFATFKESHLAKAIIHTYLSWQDPPDMHQLGLAVRTGKFEDIGGDCQAFMQWIRKLFGQPVALSRTG